jgi:regulator of protease activity HflC (stomatin/prohibitin superfamily)
VLFFFILGLLIIVGSLISFIAVKGPSRVIPVALIVVAVLLVILSGCRRVGTKEVGIPVTFGKVGSTHYGSGLHFTAPWTSIKEMDAAIQTQNDLGKDCLSVRIANNQLGCANVSLQWRINPAQVDYLYKNYRSFDHVRDQLVERKLFNAVNETLATYNPLEHITAKGSANPLPRFQSRVYAAMKAKVKDINGKPLIEVLNVQLPIVNFDNETQSRVNQLQQQVALTAIAAQREKTNVQESRANAALARNNTLTPLVLESRCLDQLEAMVKAHLAVPAGFNCGLGGSSVAGIIAR